MRVLLLRLTEDIKHKSIHPHSAEPVIGYLYSLALLKGLNLKSIDTSSHKHTMISVAESITEFNPLFLVVETKTNTAKEALKLASTLKKHNSAAKVIAVGQHVTCLPKSLIFKGSPFDIGIQGEYELVLRDYIKTQNKLLKGIVYYERGLKEQGINLVENLDELGLQGFDPQTRNHFSYYPINMLKRAKWGFMELSRGCPYSCLFCSPTLRVSYGKQYRRRSIPLIIKEIKQLLGSGVNCIKFIDDNFVNDKEYIENMCKAILKHKLSFKWVCQTRVEHLNQYLLRLMHRAGCSTICIGIESGSNKVLKRLNKGVKIEQLDKAVKMAKKARIWLVNYFMIGSPGETKSDIEASIAFCKKHKPEMVQVAFFTPYPGSEMYKKLPLHPKDEFNRFSHYNNIIFNWSNLNTKTLMSFQKKFYICYYFSPVYLLTVFPKLIPYYMLNLQLFAPLLKKTFSYIG
jgi:anaerobic magnesium-protoporphyrin IX monomethyl ester cyclase